MFINFASKFPTCWICSMLKSKMCFWYRGHQKHAKQHILFNIIPDVFIKSWFSIIVEAHVIYVSIALIHSSTQNKEFELLDEHPVKSCPFYCHHIPVKSLKYHSMPCLSHKSPTKTSKKNIKSSWNPHQILMKSPWNPLKYLPHLGKIPLPLPPPCALPVLQLTHLLLLFHLQGHRGTPEVSDEELHGRLKPLEDLVGGFFAGQNAAAWWYTYHGFVALAQPEKWWTTRQLGLL